MASKRKRPADRRAGRVPKSKHQKNSSRASTANTDRSAFAPALPHLPDEQGLADHEAFGCIRKALPEECATIGAECGLAVVVMGHEVPPTGMIVKLSDQAAVDAFMATYDQAVADGVSETDMAAQLILQWGQINKLPPQMQVVYDAMVRAFDQPSSEKMETGQEQLDRACLQITGQWARVRYMTEGECRRAGVASGFSLIALSPTTQAVAGFLVPVTGDVAGNEEVARLAAGLSDGTDGGRAALTLLFEFERERVFPPELQSICNELRALIQEREGQCLH